MTVALAWPCVVVEVRSREAPLLWEGGVSAGGRAARGYRSVMNMASFIPPLRLTHRPHVHCVRDAGFHNGVVPAQQKLLQEDGDEASGEHPRRNHHHIGAWIRREHSESSTGMMIEGRL